jgi:hypothetical protein
MAFLGFSVGRVEMAQVKFTFDAVSPSGDAMEHTLTIPFFSYTRLRSNGFLITSDVPKRHQIKAEMTLGKSVSTVCIDIIQWIGICAAKGDGIMPAKAKKIWKIYNKGIPYEPNPEILSDLARRYIAETVDHNSDVKQRLYHITNTLNTSYNNTTTPLQNRHRKMREFLLPETSEMRHIAAEQQQDAESRWMPMLSGSNNQEVPFFTKEEVNRIKAIRSAHSSKILSQLKGNENLYSGGSRKRGRRTRRARRTRRV